ncbi:MAG: diguanylate cyclase [Deltaproteobacteria bacterium]|nr:diguanylate cyclase [Deltaproteobacteria bacterium]MBW2447160.1 diguanylate cyclase [Deltaproteobacteria bacterium]
MPSAADATPLYYGVLLALALGHLTISVLRRRLASGLFAGLLASLVLSSLAWEGLALHDFWPGAEGWNRTSLVAIDALAALFAALFTREFLRSRRETPRLDPLLRALVVLPAAAIPLAAPGTWALGFELVGLVSLLGPPILLVAGVAAWRGGFRPAQPYVIAHLCLLAGLVIEATPSVPWAGFGNEVGTLALAGILSWGLAFRQREIQLEQERRETERRERETASRHDPLTELWNRRHLDEALQQVWRRALREDDVVSLLLVEVDCFESFVRRQGQPAGNECLRRVARVLAAVAGDRAEHVVARFSDERFAVLLPGVRPEAAIQVAEALRGAVAELAIPHGMSEVADRVTISLGVGTAVPDEELEPKRLLDAADQALHTAQAEGHDCTRAVN